jgi:endonuclease/exonuclease/phosphatase family metal-dependent hydrolase
VLVLTWNLFHGRAVPPAGRDLLAEFSATLAGWEWDVALLQEVPPWWPPALAAASGAQQRTALTSRNALPLLQRAVAEHWPDLIKSWGGGANAILVRGQGIQAHARRRLRLWPERRVMHAVRLDDGLWLGNLHAQVHSEHRAQQDLARAARTLAGWAGGGPFVLGGDTNVRVPLTEDLVRAGGRGVDHILVSGMEVAGKAKVLERGTLSDHPPVVANIRNASAFVEGKDPSSPSVRN